MNNIDKLSKQIFRRNDVFCQLFNLLLFNGEEVLTKEELIDLPTHECRPLGRGETDRDLLKRCTIKMDSAACYVLLGIEEQTKVDYTMPLRVLEYDISRYLWQVLMKGNQTQPDGARGLSCSEAMNRFGKGDRLFPVITAVVYLGRKPWDGPRSFRDMFPPECRRFEPFLPEYKLTLLSPWELEEEKLSALYPDLQGIFTSTKGDDYLSKLLDKWNNTDYIKQLSNDAMELINILSRCRHFVKDKGGNMRIKYRSMKEFLKSAYYEDGKKEGLKLGEEKGLRLGEEKGLRLGEEKGLRLGEEKGLRLGEEKGLRLGEEKGLRLGEEKGLRLGKEKGLRLGEEKGKAVERKNNMLSFAKNLRGVLEPRLFLSTFHCCPIKNSSHKFSE